MLRRVVLFLLLAGIPYKLTEFLNVRMRESAAYLVNNSIISLNQAVPHPLELLECAGLVFLSSVHIINCLFDRSRVGLAHENSDILHLPAKCRMALEVPGKDKSIIKFLWYPEALHLRL